MSLKYRDSSGAETPVAGLNGTSGELVPSVSLYQKGSKLSDTDNWIPGDSGIFSITFATPMPDADYDVIVGIDTPEINVSVAYDKTVNGFKAKVENVSSVTYAGRIEIYWQAFKLMTDEVREADSAHIAQNTANFASAFSEVTSYAVGDYVTYNNILYRCTTAHTAGVWVAGHFTQVTVGGDIASIDSKIPSTASSTEKLAYVEYNPSTSLYSTWAELLELLHQKGAGWWTGAIYIGKWYTYTARISIGTSGYWYGSFLAKGAETEDLVGASKIYGNTNTWTVTHYVTESNLDPGTSKTDIDSNTVYYYKSGKVVTVVFNGITISSDVAQNERIGSLEFPRAVDSYGVYFTIADYTKNNAISVVRIDARGYLLAGSSASEQAKVVPGQYWGTVTYITV